MNHLHFWINTKESDKVSYEVENESVEVNDNYFRLEKSDNFELIKETIEQYSNKLINKEISVEDKGFREISSRLYEDILSIYLSREMLFDSYFKIVEDLNVFYKNVYVATKSPTARLYQGKFSVIYELFRRKKMENLYKQMMCSNKKIKKIIWDLMFYSICSLKEDIDDQTKKDLNWLEENNYINILPVNGYVIRLSNNFKFKISLEREEYLKSYYLLSHHEENIDVIDDNQFDTSRKYLIISELCEE